MPSGTKALPEPMLTQIMLPYVTRLQWVKQQMYEKQYDYNVMGVLHTVCLTHCGLVMPFGDIDLGQHWMACCLTGRHQAITWTNVDLSLVRFCFNHLRTISHWMPKLLFHRMNLIILFLDLFPHLSGANELSDMLTSPDKLWGISFHMKKQNNHNTSLFLV